MRNPFPSLAAAGVLFAAAQAGAVTLTFEDLAVGTTLSNQYASQGVVFSSSPLSGASLSGSTNGTWATNTDMTIVSSLNTSDSGGLGTTSTGGTLVSGNILHGFNGWLTETGDANFLMTFSTPISSISVDFAGVNVPAASKLLVYNGNTLLTTLTSTVTTGQFTLSYAAPSITRVIVTPGTFDDWAAVDNIVFTPVAVPEPATWASLGLGLSAVLLAVRRRRAVEGA